MITINRRVFFTALGLTALVPLELSTGHRVFGVRRFRRYAGSGLSLPAVAAACMPESLVIDPSGCGSPMLGPADAWQRLARAGYVELRKYGPERAGELEKALARQGIRPVLTGEDGGFLFTFDTLASREKAWRESGSQAEWLELDPRLEELAIYKVPEGHSKTT